MAINIVVMASGSGSNAENIFITANNESKLHVVGLICDQPKALVLDRARLHGVPSFLIPSKGISREEHGRLVTEQLLKLDAHWILLAGYMRILPDVFIKTFSLPNGKSKIINIHPSLLPDFKGLRAYERSFESDKAYGGVTLHFVNEQLDSGEIILQEKLPKVAGEKIEDFIERGKALEHVLYQKLLVKLVEEELL